MRRNLTVLLVLRENLANVDVVASVARHREAIVLVYAMFSTVKCSLPTTGFCKRMNVIKEGGSFRNKRRATHCFDLGRGRGEVSHHRGAVLHGRLDHRLHPQEEEGTDSRRFFGRNLRLDRQHGQESGSIVFSFLLLVLYL